MAQELRRLFVDVVVSREILHRVKQQGKKTGEENSKRVRRVFLLDFSLPIVLPRRFDFPLYKLTVLSLRGWSRRAKLIFAQTCFCKITHKSVNIVRKNLLLSFSLPD